MRLGSFSLKNVGLSATNIVAVTQWSFVIIFIGLLLLPGLAGVLRWDQPKMLEEKRELARLPGLQLSTTYTKAFEAYYSDNFPFRQQLITTDSKIKTSWFMASVNPERVMVGKNGWLFYNGANGNDYIFNSYSHRNLLNEHDLTVFAGKQLSHGDSCKKTGILYIRGVCPQTHTIYPENLPYLMKIQIHGNISRTDQVSNYLRETKSDLRFIDLRSALLAAKKEHQLYRKLDTHWNDYGAFIAYCELLHQSFDLIGVKPLSEKDFIVEWLPGTEGDLVDMMASPDSFLDTVPKLTPKKKVYKENPTEGFPQRTQIMTCESCVDRRSVLIFGDSYARSLIPFFSSQFHKVTYLRSGYDQTWVKKVKPDIIFEIPVERYFF